MAAEFLSPREEWLAELQTRNLMRYFPPKTDERFATYMINGRSVWAGLAHTTESAVFGETFGNTQHDMAREYGSYETASLFLVVVDTWNTKPVGVLRVIRNMWPAGLKTLNDVREILGLSTERVCDEHGIDDLDRVWDVGSLAVRKGHRGDGYVATTLYSLLHQQCLLRCVDHVVTVLDEHAHAILLSLGVPFVPICGSSPFGYLGSAKSIACVGRVSELAPSVERTLGDCWLSRMLARGEGLQEAIAVP